MSAEDNFCCMVRRGLSLPQKQLEPAYFYDALGSTLFDAITLLPEYTISRAELAVLQAHAKAILAVADHPAEIIELGPGNGKKLASLLRHAACSCVHLIDISEEALHTAGHSIERSCGVRAQISCGTFAEGLRNLPPPTGRRLVLFLGSNIGNFPSAGATAFLRTVRAVLRPGDSLLLGADLVKEEADLLEAYDDPLGVTAAFNKNILVRINRELGADFHLPSWEHRAIWNAGLGRIEMHLVSRGAQSASIPAACVTATLQAGETIWTESSYKYSADGLRSLAETADFSFLKAWFHPEHRFVDMLFSA